MSEERALYWYDDATYDIGFYNYYQRTVDPSPWAFILCFSFCVALALLLPRYLSHYRSLHMIKDSKGKSFNSKINNTSIIVGSQEFIASDNNLHGTLQNSVRNTNQNIDNPSLPPIAETSLSNEENEKTEEQKLSQERKPKRERAFWLSRLIKRTYSHEFSNTSTQSNEDGKLDRSTNYTSMDDQESGLDAGRQAVSNSPKRSVEPARKTKETQGRVNTRDSFGGLIDSKVKDDFSCSSSEPETSNPLQMIKNDLEDFTRNNSPDDFLSVATGWEEAFDPAFQTTIYLHSQTGKRMTKKPLEPAPDDVCPWYLFYCSSAFRRKIRKCKRWDDEMEKLVGLALPYTAHTIVVDIFRLLEVGIIGRLLGTSELSAYFATEFAISFATMFFHGILASLKVLVSQAHGAKNVKLAGDFVQIGIWTHLLFSLPLVLYGWNNFDDIVLQLGLDEDTAESAEQYARFVMLYEAIGIYDGALHCVLDIAGHEKYSAITNGVRAFVSFLTVLTVFKVNRGAELWMVGAIHLIVKVLFIFSNVCVILRRQWLNEYINEMARNPFTNWRSVKTLWKASLRLSSGRVIENCEWNILFVFAAIQGPAEVAIWGLVGELWDFADNIVVAISDASKVRCAHLLGSGLPEQAKYSSEKSLLMGVAVSIIMSLSLGALQSVIPIWLTNDFTLQRLLGDMIPMVCLAVSTLSFGSVCWSILCAQGRSHLATAVTGIGSLAIALPLASLSNFYFNLNLQGLISCLIIGYASSGFFNSILMFTSNWVKISQKVRKRTSRIEEKLETNRASLGIIT